MAYFCVITETLLEKKTDLLSNYNDTG